MGLFTKLYKRNFNPYTLPGRWYKFDFDVTNSSVSSDIKDLEFVSKSSTTFIFRTSKKITDLSVCDVTFIENPTPNHSMQLGTGMVKLRADGDYTISIPSSLASFRGFIFCSD